MKKKYVFFYIIVSFFITSMIIAQTPPARFLGHEVGADRKLADYDQIQAYFRQLETESAKIKVLKIGKTTLNKPMIMAVITSEENMARLDTYRTISKQLRDARGLTDAEAKKLSREGKVILLITCSLHATEIAATQMSMEFAYKLVSGDTPFDADKVLKEVIVLLAPTINPDGHQMVTEWYRKNVGTPYEGGRMPWLYHHYAGHDNNRDWFMFNLPETRAVTKVLYHDWIPQVHIDEHQMGSTGARLFLPPFMDPPVPTIHPLVWRGIAVCGTNMAYDLQKNGYKGVVYGRNFTGWWIGACDDTAWLHNSIGLLSEMASVKDATPIYIDPTELPDSLVEKRIQYPDPWSGGWWRLRNLVDYELVLSMSLVKTSYLHKEDFLYNFYKMCKDSIEKKEEGHPFAFIIPGDQRDYPVALKMLEILMFGGIEIHRAEKDFIADGKLYPAGSFVVLMSQPYRPYAQSLLEKQTYPDLRERLTDPPNPPYDNAGWTLPLQMGVTCEAIENPFNTPLEKLENVPYPPDALPGENAAYIILDSKNNGSFPVIFALMKEKAEIYRSRDVIEGNGFHTCAGSFLIKNTPQVKKILPDLLKKWHLTAYEIENITNIAKTPLKRHRVGLYQSWRASMDEGWTRFVFDDLGIPYTTLHNDDIKGTKKKKSPLGNSYDVIVLADESPEIIKTGKPDPNSRWARYFTEMPPPYQGGIENEGVEALKDFVASGGILVCMNNASKLALKEFKKIPAKNILEKVDRSQFFCPTSLLKVNVDNTSPIGYGMPKETAVMFAESLAYSTSVPSGEWDRDVVASYPREQILLSGWLLGEKIIARKPALVDVKYKKGHIILIGFRCQHRAQSHGTYKFLLNALLYPEIN